MSNQIISKIFLTFLGGNMPTHQRKEVPSDVQNTEALSAVQSNEVHQDGNSG